jgi:ABC-type spermidine/putrescine transport system permease subunit I
VTRTEQVAGTKKSKQAGNPGVLALNRYVMRFGILLPVVVVLVYMILVYLYPISKMFLLSLFDPEFTWEHYQHFFGSPVYLNRLFFTLKVAAGVTAACIILGYPMAYLLTNAPARIRNIMMALVVMPMWISILVKTYAWMVLLGRTGIVNEALVGIGLLATPARLMHNTFAVVFGMVSMLIPYTILPMYSVMQGIDRNLLQAAQNLGANGFQTFRRIFFPLSLPGVAGGGLLVFILALGFYITPVLLGGPSDLLLANLIDVQINKLLEWGFGAAIAVVLLSVAMVLFYIYNRYLGLDKLVGGIS